MRTLWLPNNESTATRSVRRGVDPELRPHLALLAAIAAGTLLLACWPQAVLSVGYRCELQMLTGLRCPFCGMTRDFAAMLHGGWPTQNSCSWLAAGVVYLLYPAAVFASWKWNRLDWFYSRSAHAAIGAALAVMMVANNWR